MPPPAGVSVPRRPDELTSEWLTACLRHSGALSSSETCAEFTARRIGEGHGFAGINFRLELQFAAVTKGGDTAGPAPARRAASSRNSRPSTGPRARCWSPSKAMRARCASIGTWRRVRVSPRHAATSRTTIGPARASAAPRRHGPGQRGRTRGGPQLRAVRPVAGAPGGDARALLVSPRSRERSCRPPNCCGRSAIASSRRFRDSRRVTASATLRHEGVTLRSGAATGDDFIAQVTRPPLTLTHQDLHIDNVLLPNAEGGRFALIDWQSVAASRHGVADLARVLGPA